MGGPVVLPERGVRGSSAVVSPATGVARDRGAPVAARGTLLEAQGLSKHFGGHVVVDRVSCAFRAGALTSIVGPNGAGKTTLFNLLSGQLPATGGRVLLAGEDVTRLDAPRRAQRGIGRAFQLTQLFPQLSVFENVQLAVAARARVGHVFWRTSAQRRDVQEQARHYLERTGLGLRAGDVAGSLPHGDQRKLEVTLLMALKPRVFLFDEPTAGMGAEEVPAILALIAALKRDPDKAILLVEHKVDVVRRLSDRVVVLHEGTVIADGPPDAAMALPVVQQAYLGAMRRVRPVSDAP